MFGAAHEGDREAEDRTGQPPAEPPHLTGALFRAGEGQ